MFHIFLFVRTHTKFGMKIFEIDFVIEILLYLTFLNSPQGHHFNPRVKNLLAYCSTHHPRQFDMPYDHVKMPPCAPTPPKSDPWGMTQASERNSRSICFISFIFKTTYKVGMTQATD